MDIITLTVDQIDASERLREIDEDFAALIGASMATHGQHAPVLVLPMRADGKYRLIAGGHRWRGAQIEGLALQASVCDVGALEAELLEVDENLMRAELSQLDRGRFLLRRKEIYEGLHPETRQGGDRKKGKQNQAEDQNDKLSFWGKAFTEVTAEKLGLSRRTIERALERVRGLNEAVVERVKGTWIARRGVLLDELSGMDTEDQHAAVDALLAEGPDARSAKAALRAARKEEADQPSEGEIAEKAMQNLLTAWTKAPISEKERFLRVLRENGWLGSKADTTAAVGRKGRAA